MLFGEFKKLFLSSTPLTHTQSQGRIHDFGKGGGGGGPANC